MRKTILIFTLCLLSFSYGWGQTESQSPNIIYILVDDFGYGDINLQLDTLDVFRNPHVKTPNLARLARQSLVFTHHYASAPVCSPSRAGLLTSRTPTRMNIMRWINDKGDNEKMLMSGQEITIAELLQANGYETAVFGKWHLNGADWTVKENWTGWTGSFPHQQGFDYAMVTKENPHETTRMDINTQQDPGDFYLDNDEVHGKPLGKIKGFSGQIITDSAIHWVQNKRDAQKPYFLYLPYDAVHEQVESPVAYNNMYNTGNAYKDRYYANVTYLDAQIGRLLDFIYSIREEENTIIFFSSDNGPETLESYWLAIRSYGSSAPLFGQKKHLFEGGIRVPGMVRWPGQIVPGISDLPNSTLDVLPTLCEIVGTKPPQDRPIDGSSLLPHLLRNEDIRREKPLYWQTELDPIWMVEGVGYDRRFNGNRPVDIPTPRVSIRQGDYVLRGFASNREAAFARPDIFQLHDVVHDRMETVELSEFEPEIFESMKQELLEMWDDVNAEREQTQAAIESKSDLRK
jgi:arylsulfatase A